MPRRLHRWIPLAALVILIVGPGCEETFDPRGTFEDRLALFGFLTPGSDTVHIRLQTTYDPPTFDPLSYTTTPPLAGATGTLQWTSGSATLRDTIVPHPNATRYPGGMHLLTTPFRVDRGATYELRVEVPGYAPVAATASVPAPALVYFRNEDILRQPSVYEAIEVTIVVGIPPGAYGYLPRLVVEYEIISQGNRIEQREVPSALNSAASEIVPEYPRIRGTSPGRNPDSWSYELFGYPTNAYRYLLQQLQGTYGASNLRFRRAILTLTTVDRNLYLYYFLTNGYFDPNTIRTDLPDYSNVSGGVGVVGSFAVDSVVVDLPPTF